MLRARLGCAARKLVALPARGDVGEWANGRMPCFARWLGLEGQGLRGAFPHLFHCGVWAIWAALPGYCGCDSQAYVRDD